MAILITIAIAAIGIHAFVASGPLVWLLAAAIVLAALSFIDDLKGLPVLLRFGAHAAAAVTALVALDWPASPLTLDPALDFGIPTGIAIVAGFLWLAGHTNAFNFMDGINGIAASQATLVSLGYCLVAGAAGAGWSDAPILFSAAVMGAAAGFLPHNFPKARMFMGDASSAPLGFLLAALALWLASTYGMWLLVPLALLNANFVLDTGATLLRRARRREKLYEAHREHFYQRLTRAGRSHLFVTSLVGVGQVVSIGLMVFYVRADSAGRAYAAVVLIAGWMGFFLYCESLFRRSISVA